MFGLLRAARLFGSKNIEVYEMKQNTVKKKRLGNNPQWNNLAKKQSALTFSVMDFAHAVIKADLLDSQNWILPGIGFLLNMTCVIDFSSPNLRLIQGKRQNLSDFVRTGTCGRIGQGLAILFAEQ
jgi:hypothetical protein